MMSELKARIKKKPKPYEDLKQALMPATSVRG